MLGSFVYILKYHKHLIENLVQTLLQVYTTQSYADKTIEKIFKQNKKWGSRDRKFFAETLYDLVRHRRFYWNYAGMPDSEYLDTQKLGIEQIWSMWAAYLHHRNQPFPEWLQIPQSLLAIDIDQLPLAIRESYPDWFYEYGKKQLPDTWDAILKSLNQPAEIYIRTNNIKINRASLVQKLKQDNIEVEELQSELLPHALKLKERKNLFSSPSFHNGFFEVQDASSQMIAPLLDVTTGHRVVDACAGAGGKSLHIASLMKNKGKILSLDIFDWKLKELRERATRNGIDIIEVKLIESNKTIKRLEGSFDRVLLDVPCSGSGVLKRNPDAKWKLSLEEIERLKSTQYEILSVYSKMMKDNGKLVYATCSVFPEENELQIQRFLKENPDWKLLKEIHLTPNTTPYDGFYGAVLSK